MGRTFRGLASGLACLWLISVTSAPVAGIGPVEAPAGFDNLTNGAISQTAFDTAKETFEERDDAGKGLGPVYNAQSCAECHQSPVTGGISQITELRAGHYDGHTFSAPPGGSLINDRAVDGSIQEYVPDGYEVRTFRTSLNTLGDGFVEAIDDSTLINLANAQPNHMRGQVIQVDVFEAPGMKRVGRFGWKNQQASLLSFSSDAYLNEQGVTNRFNLVENTSMGRSVAAYDHAFYADNYPCAIVALGICGEDHDDDITAFAAFMRATKAPPRDPVLSLTAAAVAGGNVFKHIGCATCHVASITTAHVGTTINGGTFTVPDALGDKIIHPFGDFLLHDIGTGDGIVQNGGASTRNKLRTAPLWGVRMRSRLMHDGKSLTFEGAIRRHKGQAEEASEEFEELGPVQRAQLIAFLRSL